MKPTKPLVFYGVALFIGCISFIAFNNSFFIGAVFAASFLVIVLITVDYKFSTIIICFFILGIISSFSYYKMEVASNVLKVRLTKYNEFYSIGQYAGKNILLKGSLKSSDEGLNLIIKGKFEATADYSRGIVGTLYIDEVKRDKPDYLSQISTFKTQIYNNFAENLGKEKAALVLSLCFGDSNYLSVEQKNNFKQLGVIHAISVSGFHMAIIYKVLEGLFGIWTSMAVSLVYVLFTGAQPATLRAFIMIFILKMSKKIFKNYDGLSALCFSAIIILTLKPYFCMDLGFILSYLATLGILLYYNKVRKALYKLPNNINESISLTLSAQAFSMPYASLTLQNISFGFIPGNIILLPIYTILVILGNLSLIFYKIDLPFKLLCKLLNLFMFIMDGATYLLLGITPKATYLSIYEGCCLLLIVFSFLLVKAGFSKFKVLPLFVLLSLFLNNYRLFPNIEYIDLGLSDGVVMEYKSNRILLANDGDNIGNNIKALNSKYRFTRIIKNSKEGLTIRLEDKFVIKTLPSSSNSKGAITLEISSNNKNTIFTQSPENYIDLDLKKYDIIVLPKKNYYFSKSVNLSNIKPLSYDIVFNKVYPSFTIGRGKE